MRIIGAVDSTGNLVAATLLFITPMLIHIQYMCTNSIAQVMVVLILL